MNSRQLFKELYRIGRIELSEVVGVDFNHIDAQEEDAAYRAAKAGLTDEQIYRAQVCSWTAVKNRTRCASLPSRHSVYIQMLVFTFGRVRRSF